MDRNRREMNRCRIESGRAFHLGRPQQLPLEAVGPAVVTADQTRCVTASQGQRPGTMATHIEESTDHATVVEQHQRLVRNARREVVTRALQLARGPDVLPAAPEHGRDLTRELPWIRVEPGAR